MDKEVERIAGAITSYFKRDWDGFYDGTFHVEGWLDVKELATWIAERLTIHGKADNLPE